MEDKQYGVVEEGCQENDGHKHFCDDIEFDAEGVMDIMPSEDTSTLRQKIDGIMDTVEYEQFASKNCEQEDQYDPKKKTIMIVDDIVGIIDTIDDLFEEVEEAYNIEIHDKYNIIRVSSQMAGVKTLCLLNKRGYKVDALITDIIFGGMIKDKQNIIRVLDGVDLAAYMKAKSDNIKFMFYTGCELEDDKYSKYTQKFREYFGASMVDFSAKKRPLPDEAMEKIYQLIQRTDGDK